MSKIKTGDGWIPIKNLPDTDKKITVTWLCEDGIQDYGIYFPKEKCFATFDHRSFARITHWKMLNKTVNNEQD